MTSRRLLWAGTLLIGLAPLFARSARAQTLTLEEVEARAQRDRPELAARRARIDHARAEASEMQAKGNPTLAAKGEVSMAPGGQLVPIDAPNGDRYYVQGSRSLEEAEVGAFVPRPRYGALLAGKITLLDFGRTSLGVRAAEAAIGAERASFIEAKVELVRAARQAYLDWLEAHQSWQLGKSDVEVAGKRTTSVRELILEGARPATDATLSAYDEQLSRLREARARRMAEVAFEALAASLGGPLPSSVVPDLAVIEPEPGVLPAAAPSADDPTLRALTLQQDAALSAARAADRWRAPQLEAAAELGLSGQETQLFPVYRAALSLSVPIFDGGALSAQAEQHRAEARGLGARREIAESKLRAHQSAAQSALRAAGEELAMTEELLRTAETLVSEAEDHYRAGSDTLERVLSAQRSLVQARGEVLTAKLDNARARLELTPVKLEP